MFGLRKGRSEPLADVKSAGRWLATLPAGDALHVQREIAGQLTKLTKTDARHTPGGLAAVFYVDAQAHAVRKTLTTQYVGHTGRSSRIDTKLWQALFDLTRAFIGCYGAYAHTVAARAQSARWRALLPEFVARQIFQLGLDARVRLYRCEPWIPARWAELHTLFDFACTQRFEREAMFLHPGAGSTSIEHEYVMALVLERMDPGSLGPAQVEWLALHLQDWCRTLRLTLEPASPTTFFVDLASRAGLKRRNHGPLEGRVLFLDTRPLHAVLLQNVVSLEQRLREEPLGNDTLRVQARHALLTKLAAQIDPEFRPLPRRGKRVDASGTIEAVVGFAKIAACLHDATLGALEDDPVRTFSGAVELAVFGQSRNEAGRLRKIAEQRLASYLAAGGPWEVKDVSASGFRVVVSSAATEAIALGTLVALRLRDQNRWVLCIVRRMARRTNERVELGLEIMANALSGIELVEQRKFADTGYSVDGEQATVSGRTFSGLLLSVTARPGGPDVQSVVIPATEYQPAKRYKAKTVRATFPLRFGRQLDAQSDWAWIAIEPLERSAARADAASPAL
jgi:hypothetical protein